MSRDTDTGEPAYNGRDYHKNEWPYEDIVNLPHHVSSVHMPMPIIKRAAQFAPFAALTGYDDAVAETARLTDDRVDLTEDAVNELSRRIHEAFASGREIRIIHFVPDDRKDGGAYVEITGKIRKIEAGEIILEDGSRIQTEDVVDAGWADP